MPQKDVKMSVDRQFDFLEPGMNPEYARTMHCKLVPAANGTFVTYLQGQVVVQKNDGTNNWAKLGTAGFTGPRRIVKYTVTVNDQGFWQYGKTFYQENSGPNTEEGTVATYYRGYFKSQDLIGTNEVQTETVTATGGTRTLSFAGQVTTALAYNANAATIQAALEALSNVDPGDVAVSGTGPYVYTFGGQYGGRDVPPIIVGTGSLTGGSSTMAQTSGGLADVGTLIAGTRDAGMVHFQGV